MPKRNSKKEMFKKKTFKQRKLRNPSKLKSLWKTGRPGSRAPIAGDICQFVHFSGARAQGTGCQDGAKVVISQRTGVRKQFLITGGRTIFGFVAKKGGKFGDCACATDITASAKCKVHPRLNKIHILKFESHKLYEENLTPVPDLINNVR